MNSLFVIAPYKFSGMWVFDDERVGLNKEPFVSGADTMIDMATVKIPDAENGFRMIFATEPFPGYGLKLEWSRPEYGGNWYSCEQLGTEGWLCPALFKYFPEAPREIYVRVEARQ